MLIDSIEVACWMHTGERQAAKIRMAYLRSMLNQDISLFDTEASTGEVISSITTDIIVVQDALSEKVFLYLHSHPIIDYVSLHFHFASQCQISFVSSIRTCCTCSFCKGKTGRVKQI